MLGEEIEVRRKVKHVRSCRQAAKCHLLLSGDDDVSSAKGMTFGVLPHKEEASGLSSVLLHVHLEETC